MSLPAVSVVIATFNSSRTLNLCLQSVRNQKYPLSKIELIISDGGSTDSTLTMAKKFGAKIVRPPKKLQGAEFNKGYGLQFARGDYILCIDHDNVLPHSEWLKSMLEPFTKHKNLVAVEPLRYHYDKNLSLLDRYFALFGVNDPLPYYLGKADRMDYIHSKYNLIGQAQDMASYFLVNFDKRNPSYIPTLGANGFLIKRTMFLKSNHKPEFYFHIDINVDLVGSGYTQYAFVKDSIIHLTNSQFVNFVSRRAFFMSKYYLNDSSKRRYSVFEPKYDLWALVKYMIYALTLIKPTIDSIRGYVKTHDLAWFVHPIMCFTMVNIYTYTFILGKLRK